MNAGEEAANADHGYAACPTCHVRYKGYMIRGCTCDDVLPVLREVQQLQDAARGPWRAGFFYMLVLIVVLTFVLTIARTVAAWLMPVVLAFGLAGLVVVGVLQQSHDKKISEKAMARLLTAALHPVRGGSAAQTTEVRPEEPN